MSLPRAQYNAIVRSAIHDVTAELASLTLEQLQIALSEHLEIEPPGKVTLSKLVKTMGWIRHDRPGAATLWLNPSSIVPTGGLN